MRTYAAHAADLDRARYTEKPQHDVKTEDGAKALLGERDAGQLARQLIARIYRNGVVPFVESSSHIIAALETLGLVEREERENRNTVLMLTDKGQQLASKKKAA